MPLPDGLRNLRDQSLHQRLGDLIVCQVPALSLSLKVLDETSLAFSVCLMLKLKLFDCKVLPVVVSQQVKRLNSVRHIREVVFVNRDDAHT